MEGKIIKRWEDLLSVIIELEIVSESRQLSFFERKDIFENMQRWRNLEDCLVQNIINWLEKEFGTKIELEQLCSDYSKLDLAKDIVQEIVNEILQYKIPYRGKKKLVNRISTNPVLVCYIVLTFINQKQYKEAIYWARILEESKKQGKIECDKILLNCIKKCLNILNRVIYEIEKELMERNIILYDLILFKLYQKEGKLHTEDYYKDFPDMYPQLLELKLILSTI